MTLIDTNVILRFLLNDVPEQAEQAKAVIEAGAFTTIEVIAEVVYIGGVYSLHSLSSVERAGTLL